MAVYKVPQDVEAEDKLIGPFGFRQFIYLIIVAFACFVAYILSKVFIGLILIPMPFILFFAALALPLRKDQPTETYLAAILQYNLKPKKRMWMPDGVLSTVEITAPKTVEEKRTKDLSEQEAIERIERLSQIMDTRGWATRGVSNPTVNSTANVNLAQSIVAEADAAKDILEETSFDKLINQQKEISQKHVKSEMQKATTAKPSPVQKAKKPVTNKSEKEVSEEDLPKIKYTPYPQSIHQAVIQPIGASKANDDDDSKSKTKNSSKSTSDNQPSPDIINLVENSEGLKVSTIAKQADRLEHKQAEEVDVKLH